MNREDEILAELKKINAQIRDFQQNIGKTIFLAIIGSILIFSVLSLFF